MILSATAHTTPPDMQAELPKSFPATVKFRHEWRPYQARVLAQLDAHLGDQHFHLVAAPGSGKTVVGLEALLRVGKPALIFAPTIAIRDQWIRRFQESFWNEAQPPPWISIDPAQPGLLTIVTYQSLTHFDKNRALHTLITGLDAAGVRTLVFDEAHHLRNQWWKALDQIKVALKSPFIIALTATPPYDVSQVEWNRYTSICGVVDEEISAPELVKAQNLCPHQDFVYFSEPTAQESKRLEAFDRGISSLLSDIALNEAFIKAFEQHPMLARPSDSIDELLADSDYYLSIAVFLKHATGVAPEGLISVLGLEGVALPSFNAGWAEVLFQAALFSDRDSFRGHDDVMRQLHGALIAQGAIERQKVLLLSSAKNNRLLRSSVSKLRSVADIVELECRTMDWRLRMLVLTDYIREEDFPAEDGGKEKFRKIGVVPIFEYLRKLRLPNVRLGVLTGQLVIIPTSAVTALPAVALALGIDGSGLTTQALWHDAAYSKLEAAGDSGVLLELVTRLLTDGHINVMVGTAALLGEGWDAPAVNSLVMATVVGAFVTSNQIRGRAIRVDPQDPYKTANIWHLACVQQRPVGDEPRYPVDERDLERDTDDWSLLVRRFRAFVGLRHDEAVIESAIDRLGVSTPISGAAIPSLNARMCRDAGKRDQMAEVWQQALFNPSVRYSRVVNEVLVPIPRVPSHPVFRYWLRWRGGWLERWRQWWLERRVSRIGQVVLESLRSLGLIGDGGATAVVTSGRNSILVRLAGASRREESLFIGALREVFDPLQSPRYLLVTKDEEFAVPRMLAERKERAESFARQWRMLVGRVRLLYTQTPEGKRRLLRAKERHLAAKHRSRTEARLRWS
jgi:superfamily II DNA or RNA helicase